MWRSRESEVPTIHRRDHQQGKSYRKPLSTVEETRNKMLDAELDALYEAQFDEHRLDCWDGRARSYACKLYAKAGEVTLKMAKLRGQPSFETGMVERDLWRRCCRRRDGLSADHGCPMASSDLV